MFLAFLEKLRKKESMKLTMLLKKKSVELPLQQLTANMNQKRGTMLMLTVRDMLTISKI